MPKIVNTKW